MWFVIGTPSTTIANLFWASDAAPWESVDAFYYPDKNNLTTHVSKSGFKNLVECRDWVDAEARRNNDPYLMRGDYECGVGFLRYSGDLKVYRLTQE